MEKLPNSKAGSLVELCKPELSVRTTALLLKLDAMAGAVSKPMSAPRASTPGVLIFKVMGKMFAILSMRGIENVILKCDPNLVHILRAQYTGVGHRSHLDRRYWVSINLDADVPMHEVERLAEHSYGLVCSGLTRKQKADLAVLSAQQTVVRQ